MKKIIRLSVTTALILSMQGCGMTALDVPDFLNKETLAVGGVAGGAVIGKQLGGTEGMLIGAAVGGIAGWLLGSELDDRRSALLAIAKKNDLKISFVNIQEGVANHTEQNKSTETVGQIISIEDSKQFKAGSDTVQNGAQKYYTDIAKEYAKSDKKVLIVGHTDDTGDAKKNQTLSEKRAKNITKIFKEHGVKESNLYFQGVGESMPMASNSTKEGRTKNRRVEIVELNDEKELALFENKRNANTVTLAKPKIKPKKIQIKESKDFIDFAGSLAKNDKLNILDQVGDISDNSFSLITQARADDDKIMSLRVSCLYDKPKISGKIKKLSTDSALETNTTDYVPGLYKTVWYDNVNKHLISISPMAVLKDGYKVNTTPKVSVYKNYQKGSNKKPDTTIETYVNTYAGEDALLFRIFMKKNTNSMACADIILPYDGQFQAKSAKLYYIKGGKEYVSEFRPKMLKIAKK